MLRWWFFFSLFVFVVSAKGNGPGGANLPNANAKKWLTLSGRRPVVVARGGFSGIFPESSDQANQMAATFSVPDVVVLCNVQLTSDSFGVCQPDVNLANTTNIEKIFPKKSKTYNVNGKDVTGYFAFDFTSDQLLGNVSLVQNVFSRSSAFDGLVAMSAVEDLAGSKLPAIWLNVPYDAFYTQHKLSVSSFILEGVNLKLINYISSPEIGFLKAIKPKLGPARTKLMFVFKKKNEMEPTTKQTYESILKDLAAIKSFSSGIVVPKDYIMPVSKDNYLEPPTTLVTDAHKAGLEVYVSGLANDFLFSYNYSYNPINEYLQFVGGPQFCVDGLITDFPSTASSAVACFAQYGESKTKKGEQALVITHNGASGVYPGCTDLAYQQAVDDGADIIDCSVQLSSDGVAFCLDSADLAQGTTAVATFMSRSTTVPEIQPGPGIFSFDFQWSEIQTLSPQQDSPFQKEFGLQRNPANKNKGKLVTLSEFLEFAKTKAVKGVLINIQNAAYLASKKGLDIVTTVSTALSNVTLDKQVLIQSDDTSVLSKFQNVPAYKRVLFLNQVIGDAPPPSVAEIKKNADAVVLLRSSIIPTTPEYFTKQKTKLVDEMHAANLTVYVTVLKNEFPGLAVDYAADPVAEVATFVSRQAIGVDGIITEFPATATRYLRNLCSDPNAKVDFIISAIEPGSLLTAVPPNGLSPAPAPSPALEVADVVDPPLPPVTKDSPADGPSAASSKSKSSAFANVASVSITLVAIMLAILFSIEY